jgi:hypothetical protein
MGESMMVLLIKILKDKDTYTFIDKTGNTPQFDLSVDVYNALMLQWISEHIDLKKEDAHW